MANLQQAASKFQFFDATVFAITTGVVYVIGSSWQSLIQRLIDLIVPKNLSKQLLWSFIISIIITILGIVAIWALLKVKYTYQKVKDGIEKKRH